MKEFGEYSLVRTKLAPPKMGGSPLTRDSLTQLLNSKRSAKVTVVQGPAGAGKTMLLAQWRKLLLAEGADVAWYNAGPDDDESQIAAYIAESLRSTGIPINTESVQLFSRSGAKSWKPLLSSLVNDVMHHRNEIYLFIDDFQHISSYNLLQLIDRWVSAAPAQFHLVIGTRMRPPLDLANFRAQGQVNELSFAELQFNAAETREFVESQGISHLDAKQISALQSITDGWAAGLQLLAFSLRREEKPDAFISQQSKLSLSQEDALNSYLDRAVAEHLSEDEITFLTRISLCRRFNQSLCELIAGDVQAPQYLKKFEEENLFLLRIDTADSEPWYRFHRLFANFLQSKLRAQSPESIRSMHQLAAQWFADHNFNVEALRHARAADDTEFMVELIDRAAREMINNANFIDLLHWADAVPGEILNKRLNIDLCVGWAQLSCSRIKQFKDTIQAIELQLSMETSRVRNELWTEVQLLKAFYNFRQDNTAMQLEIIEPLLLEEPPANTFQRLLLHNLAGLGMVYANRFAEAREIVRAQRNYTSGGTSENPRPFLDVVEGMSHLVQGHIRLALDQLLPVYNSVQRTSRMGSEAISFIIGYLVEATYQSDNLDEARDLLDKSMDLVDAFGSADSVLLCYRVRARIESLDGDDAGAIRTLRRMEDLALQQKLDRLVAWSLYEQLLLAIKSSHRAAIDDFLARLERLDAKYDGELDCANGEIPLAYFLARAEAAFYGSDPEASRYLNEAQNACCVRGRQLQIVRVGLLSAIVKLRAGLTAEAIEECESLLDIAYDLGMLRIFFDIPAVCEIADAVLKRNPRTRHCQQLQSVLSAGSAISSTGSEVARDTSDLLTTREVDVLMQLSKGFSTKGIARELTLSPGTVKWHLKNIYGKLGAFSRDDALSKARSVALID